MRMVKFFLHLPRSAKLVGKSVLDIGILWLALWLAFVIRLGSFQPVNPLGEYLWLFLLVPLTAWPYFFFFGLYRIVLRYFDLSCLIAIGKAMTLAALTLAVVIYLWRPNEIVPRSLVPIYGCLGILGIAGVRLFLRHTLLGPYGLREVFNARRRTRGLIRVAIYGAGAAGTQLAAALQRDESLLPVAFIDDDQGLRGRLIAGLKVYAPDQVRRMIRDTDATEVLIAIPSLSRLRKRAILEFLEAIPIHVRTVPSLTDLASGRVRVEDLQEVDIADLLGREVVEPSSALMQRCITGKAVLVTGAGGSIGSELCRQILTQQPRALVLYEHAEFNLYQIQRELEERIRSQGLETTLIPILGSVHNAQRLHSVLRAWQVATVYHAAAYKHVPIVEHNIVEGITNNVFGTLATAQAAIRAGVENFVLISTDKAVRPTNVMGSTKRIAEMVLQALSCESAPLLFEGPEALHAVNQTRFVMVRFGNVLGSSGSVIPLFREQIRQGGPVTVTHPGVTRYFMTIPEAAQLVIQAGSMGQGGEVFVLDMGAPIRILDLAEKMIHLSGFSVRSEAQPGGDIEVVFSGLRPGEKLYEELWLGEHIVDTDHPRIKCALEEHLPWDALGQVLSRLDEAVRQEDSVQLLGIIQAVVKGYQPQGEIVDYLHEQASARG